VNDIDQLGSDRFYFPFSSQFWIVARLVCSIYEAMAGSLSAASIAILSEKVAVVDSGEVRPAVYDMYNNGPRTLP
jgi:hypothetical protein